MSLQRVCLIGASGGIGQALSHVAPAAWDMNKPQRTELDLMNASSICDYFTDKLFDLLVVSAGILDDATLSNMKVESWEQTFQMHFMGAKQCAQAVLPSMQQQQCGHILFISSYSALHPPIGQAAYATAKAALIGYAQQLAHQYGKDNIRVNVILPGFLETKMTQAVKPSRKEMIAQDHVLKRFNTTDLVAQFIIFLHQTMLHTSGQVFQLDSRIGFLPLMDD